GYEVKNEWGKIKDTIGDFFAPVGAGAGWIGEKVSDWWYGKPYDMSQLRERWGNMDWEGSATNGIDDALAKYADAINKAGKTDSDISKLFGIDGGNSDIATRGIYSSIEKLANALKGLADDAKTYAEVIRNAADESNVSENVAAAAVKALNITDTDQAKNIISELEQYKDLGDKESLRKVLKNHDVSDDQIDNIINQMSDSASSFYTDATESYLKKNEIVKDEQTAKFFGGTGNKTRSKSADMSDDVRFASGNVNTDAGMAELLGLDVNVSDGWWDQHLDNDISTSDRQKINQNTLAYISETAELMQNKDKWNSLTFQEQTDRLNAIYLGAPLLSQNGLTSKSIQDALQNNSSFRELYYGDNASDNGMISADARKNLGWTGSKEIIDNYLLNDDDKKAYYEKKTGKTVETYSNVYSAISTEDWSEFLDNGTSNMYDSDTPTVDVKSKYKNMTVDEMIDAIKKDNKDLDKELEEKSTAKTQTGQDIIDSITDPEKKREVAKLILGEGGATADQLRGYGIDNEKITNYTAANEDYNNTYDLIKAGEDLMSEYGEYAEDSEAKAAAFLMLGESVGVDAKKLATMKKNMTDFRDKDVTETEEMFENAKSVISEAMFGENLIGTEINDDTKKVISERLTNQLSKSGAFKQEEIQSFVSDFVNNGLKNGDVLGKDSVNTFTQAVLNGLTNGNLMTSDASLETSMKDLKKSVDSATEAIKGIPFWSDKSRDSSDSNSDGNSGGYTSTPNVVDTSAAAAAASNQNGTSSSSSSGSVTFRQT
ncbi:MAG: hypothetical protein ACI4RS_03915, partial [Monoglobaceae bacterium]